MLALSIAVHLRAVKGAPPGLPTPPTSALFAWLLPFRRSGRLRRLRKISLEMSKLLAAVALVVAGRSHRGSPARDGRPGRLARLLVHKEVVGRVLKTVDRCKFVSVVHLPDKVVFRGRRPARDHDIQVDFVGYFLPQSLEAELELASLGEEANRIPIRNVREGEELLVARSSSFLGVGVEPHVQSRPSQLSVAFGASARHSVSLNCDPRQAGSREEQEGVEAAVGFVPQAVTSAGVAARESGRADPCKPVTSSGAWTLMTCSKHSFYTRKVDPEHCPMESSKRWSPE